MNRLTTIRHIALIRCAVALFVAYTLLVNGAMAESTEFQLIPTKLTTPNIEAKAWALLEYNSGLLIAGNHADMPHPPASITKLMTNYVLFDAIKRGDAKLGDLVSISEKAWRTEGSRMFAKVDSKVELQHLLKSTIVQSGNDAAVALAEHLAGSELSFTQMMNKSAVRLGLEQSYFMNATGLPADMHVMSAHDIAKMAAAIIHDFPYFYSWYAEKEFTHNNITQYNRNKLLWKDSSVDGLKTGHTEAAGFCLVGSAARDGQRWIAVVLGAKDERSREQAVLSLLDFAFAAYTPIRVLDKQGGLATARVYFGEVDEVLLQPEENINLVVPAGRENDVVNEVRISPYYQAPIQLGQAMGVVTLSLDGQLLADVPLVAMSSIKIGSIWKKFTDSIRLKLRERSDL